MEAREEALSIASRRTRQSCPSQQRSNPSEEIQPFMMVTGRRHFQPPSTLGPPHTQPRMKGEPCFVLKHNRLTRSQVPKFFLTHAEIAGPLPFWLVDRNTPPVSSGIPIDASIAGPAAQSVSDQTADLNALPMLARPTVPYSNPLPTGSSLNRTPLAGEPAPSIEPERPGRLLGFKASSPCSFTW